MEYVMGHGGGRGRIIEYEMVYSGEGRDDSQFLMGLIDVKKLGYGEKNTGVNTEKSGSKTAPKRR